MSTELVWYECPKCGRVVQLPKGRYFCSVCGPTAIMVETKEKPIEEVVSLLKRHPAMHAVYNVLDMDKTLSTTTKNVLWQDFVAAWNRRKLITNEEAELLLSLRW